jgi:hypothetical protein
MKRAALFPVLAALLFIMASPVLGTTWADIKKKCPICQTEDTYSEIMSYGGYIYEWDSKFQFIFWPDTDEHILYACQKCHFTCRKYDFGRIPADKIGAVKKSLNGTKLSPPDLSKKSKWSHSNAQYCHIPMTERIVIAERVYRELGKDDEWWCTFYRMKGYHFDEADMSREAEEARKNALNLADKMMADKNNKGKLKELLLISGSMKHFLGDLAGAEKDFRKALTSPYSDSKLSSGQAKGKEDYLNRLLNEFLASGASLDIILAISAGSTAKAGRLLDKSPTLCNARDSKGNPLIITAALTGKSEMVKLLISRGADVNARDKKGRTALAVAKESSNKEIEKLLLEHGAKQ